MSKNKSKRQRHEVTLSNDYCKDFNKVTGLVNAYLDKFEEDYSHTDANFMANIIANEAFKFICTKDGPEAARRDLDYLRNGLGDEQSSTASSPDTKLLRAMIADPGGTQRDWATATDVAKSSVYRGLKRLQEQGLVHGAGGKWTVTQTGRRTT
jgi:hypothetical protein